MPTRSGANPEENPIRLSVLDSYRSLTFITTYQCTAACKECCFECSPALHSGQLTHDFMRRVIDDALLTLPNLQVVVFSGGECFMLKKHLYETIAYASSRGLKTRCVTNGYWGAKEESARRIAAILHSAGITEMNISTGLDHQQWVPFESVVHCASALVAEGIQTLITVEKDTETSRCFTAAREHPEIIRLLEEIPRTLTLHCNVWMPFTTDSVGRGDENGDALAGGCKQLFSNLVITPHRVVSACCGLTFEHIPEMRLGMYDSRALPEHIDDVASDFLKLWIHMDGVRAVARAVLGKRHDRIEQSVHMCQACAILHKDDEIRAALQERYHEFMPDVMSRYLVKRALERLGGGVNEVNNTFRDSLDRQPSRAGRINNLERESLV